MNYIRRGLRVWIDDVWKLVSKRKDVYIRYSNDNNEENRLKYKRLSALMKQITRQESTETTGINIQVSVKYKLMYEN